MRDKRLERILSRMTSGTMGGQSRVASQASTNQLLKPNFTSSCECKIWRDSINGENTGYANYVNRYTAGFGTGVGTVVDNKIYCRYYDYYLFDPDNIISLDLSHPGPLEDVPRINVSPPGEYWYGFETFGDGDGRIWMGMTEQDWQYPGWYRSIRAVDDPFNASSNLGNFFVAHPDFMMNYDTETFYPYPSGPAWSLWHPADGNFYTMQVYWNWTTRDSYQELRIHRVSYGNDVTLITTDGTPIDQGLHNNGNYYPYNVQDYYNWVPTLDGGLWCVVHAHIPGLAYEDWSILQNIYFIRRYSIFDGSHQDFYITPTPENPSFDTLLIYPTPGKRDSVSVLLDSNMYEGPTVNPYVKIAPSRGVVRSKNPFCEISEVVFCFWSPLQDRIIVGGIGEEDTTTIYALRGNC